MRPGDFTGDGRTDLLLYNVTTGERFVSIADGAGGWSSHVPGSWSPNWQILVTSFNLDSQADILLYNTTSGSYFQGISTGTWAFTYHSGNWGGAKVLVATSP